ncbi:MAG: gamma-glutamylcyclotransferase family protein [Planctomycetota bacterium]|nr:gamma-glutamylcyclotransferase family protein [Planctomycetota bacterium]
MTPALPIFVYGSLRKGMTQHAILAGAQFLGSAMTKPEYTLLDAGAWPAAVRDGNTAIVGELYEVKPNKVSEIDRYERHPNFFCRQKIMLADEIMAWMWIYVSEVHPSWLRIEDGCWRQQ